MTGYNPFARPSMLFKHPKKKVKDIAGQATYIPKKTYGEIGKTLIPSTATPAPSPLPTEPSLSPSPMPMLMEEMGKAKRRTRGRRRRGRASTILAGRLISEHGKKLLGE